MWNGNNYDLIKGVRTYTKKSGGSWSLTKTYDNPDASPAANDYFGAGCGIARTTKDKFVIGMLGDDTDGTDYGSVWTYTNVIPKYLDFDTYNKLTINDITPTSTTLKYGSNTYDTGTATSIYIKDVGTYDAEITASDKFALVSNVVSGTISAHPGTPLITSVLVTRNDGTDYTEESPNTERNSAWAALFVDGDSVTREMDGANGTNVGFSMYLNFDKTFTVNTAVFKMDSTYSTYKDLSFRCGESDSSYITVDPGEQDYSTKRTITFTFSSPITVNKLYFAVYQDGGTDLYNLRMTNGDLISAV